MYAHRLAIETRYAGCRFRSRLEARWAVFFDALRIPWEYEPEGFEHPRWGSTGPIDRYLPDFYLPTVGRCHPRWSEGGFDGPEVGSMPGTYVEVKGTDEMASDDYRQGLAMMMEFKATPLGRGLLLLGPIPRPGVLATHWHVKWAKGILAELVVFDLGVGTGDLYPFRGYPRYGGGGEDRLGPASWDAPQFRGYITSPAVDEAYATARSARFEHGERG